MYIEDDYVPLSALQHWVFCPRQCALIHVDRAWEENALTAQGRVLHTKVHNDRTEWVDGVLVARGLALASARLGLSGQTDVVEFHPICDAETDASRTNAAQTSGILLPGREGLWRLFPVEYKRGKKKSHQADEVQLCAQAICLEEMLGANIPDGALFYGKSRRRTPVVFTDSLRRQTEDVALRVHEMIMGSVSPRPKYAARCKSCSLMSYCMPKTKSRAQGYIDRTLKLMATSGPETEPEDFTEDVS